LDLFTPYPEEENLESAYTLTHKPDSMPGSSMKMIARINRLDADVPEGRLRVTISYPLDDEEATLCDVDFDADNFDEMVELMEKPEIKDIQSMLALIGTNALPEFKPPVNQE
jgi:hypothetical protein